MTLLALAPELLGNDWQQNQQLKPERSIKRNVRGRLTENYKVLKSLSAGANIYRGEGGGQIGMMELYAVHKLHHGADRSVITAQPEP